MVRHFVKHLLVHVKTNARAEGCTTPLPVQPSDSIAFVYYCKIFCLRQVPLCTDCWFDKSEKGRESAIVMSL